MQIISIILICTAVLVALSIPFLRDMAEKENIEGLKERGILE